MKTWLKSIAIALSVVTVMVITGCGDTTAEASDNEYKRLNVIHEQWVDTNITVYVVVDNSTGVEYMVVDRINGGAAITIMENPDGSNRIWSGYEGWLMTHGY